MEHIEMKNGLDSKLQIYSVCSFRIRSKSKISSKKRSSLVSTPLELFF